jgi:hypothetical protein
VRPRQLLELTDLLVILMAFAPNKAVDLGIARDT